MDAQHWVFGYGSLIYRVDFPVRERRRAHIRGWARRFWQGSHDHRGTPDAPGRVVTLVPEAGHRCEGVAYRIDEAVFEHLDYREKNGYQRVDMALHFNEGLLGSGTVYVADPHNPAFLGPTSEQAMAAQIAAAHGPSGSNREYLLELARVLTDMKADDPHVFSLAARVSGLAAPD